MPADEGFLILKIVFLIAALVQLFYFAYFYIRLALYKPAARAAKLPPVSVVIAARNEYENLASNLPAILEQDYPGFEVVVVNDGSWDESHGLLTEFQKRYSNLKIVTRPENDRHDGGKKLALTLGVKGAQYDRLLFTDADCRPISRKWIAGMVTMAASDRTIVLGYSPYIKRAGLLNALIRFETTVTALNYFSFALAGNPYMGVGRNLSYSKSTFMEVGGFKKHYSIASGDDDLMVNQIANSSNTQISITLEAHVESAPKLALRSYWRQKRRHLSTSWRYKTSHKYLLALPPITYILLIGSGIFLIVFHTWLYIVAATIALRVLLQIFIFSKSSRWLGQRDLLALVPFLEIVNTVLSGFIHMANATSKQKKWKN